jgi:hypothetical protein
LMDAKIELSFRLFHAELVVLAASPDEYFF